MPFGIHPKSPTPLAELGSIEYFLTTSPISLVEVISLCILFISYLYRCFLDFYSYIRDEVK